MTKERNAIMKKARAKKQRRKEVKAAKATRKTEAGAGAPATGLGEKVVDIVQEAAIQVGKLAKAAAGKISGHAC